MTGADGRDGVPVPASLVATTVKLYAVPFVSPVTVQVRAPEVEHVKPPGDAVTA